MGRKFIIVCLTLVLSLGAQAKTKKFGTWIDAEFSKKISKSFDFSLIPEVRLEDNFSIDEYMLESTLSWDPFKYLNFAAGYRISNNLKKSGNEWTSRFALDAEGNKKFGRVESSLRLRFTNYSDFDDETSDKKSYFRYRIKLIYDLRNSKINPFTAYELFHRLNEGELNKSRFDIGFNWNLSQKNRISVYYRLQDYFTYQNSIHILGLGYRLKF